jgi:hypothetical protein
VSKRPLAAVTAIFSCATRAAFSWLAHRQSAAAGKSPQPRTPMAKTRDSKSQTKKAALQTPEQKRQAKREKKARKAG